MHLNWQALRLTLLYLAAGLFWILCSDWLVDHLVPAEFTVTAQSLKGGFYIFATSLVGYWLVAGFGRAIAQEERRYRELFDQAHTIMLVIDPANYDIVDANEAAVRFYGYSHDELTRMNVADINPAPRELLEETRQAEQTTPIHLRTTTHRLASGEIRQVEVYSGPIEFGKHRRLLSVIHDVTELRTAESQVRAGEERFRALVDNAPQPIFIKVGGRFAYLNREACSVFGCADPSRLLGQPIGDRFAEAARPEIDAIIQRLTEEHSGGFWELEIVRLDGTRFPAEMWAAPYAHEGEQGTVVFLRDISERKEAERERIALEERLRRAQKLEAIGRLAGGVAHDFNNMLSVILGYADAATETEELSDALRSDLNEIRHAAERSARLTQQLLAFSRGMPSQPRSVDLGQVLGGQINMLRRLVGEDIDLNLEVAPDLWLVRIDPSHVDQIVANLVVNARDAITGPGAISVHVANHLATESNSAIDLAPGTYVMLEVRDTGCGMDPETLAHIYEPFFTTKPEGKGTGLGLSTVYGIVQQNRGRIGLSSVPGEGTQFRLYFPRDEGLLPAPAADPVHAPLQGTEHVLIVEDQPEVLAIAQRILQRLGYQTYATTSPNEALRMMNEESYQVDLLLTDITMPEMDGFELCEAARASRPTLRCLYMSGYTADILEERNIDLNTIRLVRKPFSLQTLGENVRAALDE